MYTVDLFLRVRLACHVDGLSQREAASRSGGARETVRKMLRHSEPPGYRRRQPPSCPKLAPFTAVIDRWSRPNGVSSTHGEVIRAPCDEHGFTGKETIVKDYVRERRLRLRCLCRCILGHAQAALARRMRSSPASSIGRIFSSWLPTAIACFVLPGATTEACWTGTTEPLFFSAAFPNRFFTTTTRSVSRILSVHAATNAAVQRAQSHYLFDDRTVPARVTTKAMWRGWSAMPGGLHDGPGSRAMATWKSNAATGKATSCAATARANGSWRSVEEATRRVRRVRQAGHAGNSLSLSLPANGYSKCVAYGHQEVWSRGCPRGGYRTPGSLPDTPGYDREDMVFDPIHTCLCGAQDRRPGSGRAASRMRHCLMLPTLRRLLKARMGKAGKREYAVLRLLGPSISGHGAVKDRLRLGGATTPSNTLCCAGSSGAQARPGYLSLPASGQRRPRPPQLYELVGWRRVMTDTPQVLLAHHLKTLKLPTFLREYDKLAPMRHRGRRICAILSV